MRVIWDKISEEYKKSIALRSLAFHEDIKDLHNIRKDQQKSWEKFNFFKKLNKAIEKQKKKENTNDGV